MAGSEFSLEPGFFLGHYRITRGVGRDACGELYVAKHTERQRDCLLRLFAPSVVAEAGFRQRFEELGGKLKLLKHHHLVRVHDAGEEFGHMYLACDWVGHPDSEQRNLAHEVPEDGWSEGDVEDLLRQLAEGLRHVHEHGLVHGDLGAASILFADGERLKIGNVGFASLLGAGYTDFSECVSPERKRGEACSPASDIYSVGAIMYRMLTGNVFVEGCPPPSACGKDEAWDRLLARCLHPDPRQRYASMEELRAAIDRMHEKPKSTKAKAVNVALAVVTLVVLALVGLKVRDRFAPAEDAAGEGEPGTVAESATSSAADVGALLADARSALRRTDYDAAADAIGRVLAVTPDSPDALALKEEIELGRDPSQLKALKAAAEAAWAETEKLDGGQGFNDALNAVWRERKTANAALKTLQLKTAADGFRKVVAECARLRELDGRRKELAVEQKRALAAREAAWGAGATDVAPALWEEAVALAKRADEAFENGAFDEAEAGWLSAQAKFVLAQGSVKGADLAQAAKGAFERKRDAADLDLLKKADPEAWQRLQDATAQAEKAMGELKWPAAVKSWHRAMLALTSARPATEAADKKGAFEGAMRRGEAALAEKRWRDAEYEFFKALEVDGYEEDAEAAGKFELARRRRRESPTQQRIAKHLAAADLKGNRVQNSGFEEGEGGTPALWSTLDGLTSFWEQGGVKGKCIRMDTDVYREEWEKHRNELDKPITKTKTVGNKYNTVGGTCGVALYSYPIPVEEDGWYMVSYDIKAPGGEPFVFVKGYWHVEAEDCDRFGNDIIFFRPDPLGPDFSMMQAGTSVEEKVRHQPRPGDYMQSYRGRCVCRYPQGEKNTWRHYERAIHLERRHHAEVVMVQLYAFWPVGDYRFDNIGFRKITEAEAEAYEKHRQELGEAANFGTPVKGR